MTRSHTSRPSRSVFTAIGWLISLALIGSLCFWAGHVVTRAPATHSEVPKETLETRVTTETVGRTLTYNVTITQSRVPVAMNLKEGVVTEVKEQESYEQGDTIYSVDSTPIRVINGTTPFFRDLQRDVEGPDVLELGQALVDMGYMGSAGTIFGPVTEKAVKAWQKDLGQEETGIITRGELIAIPSLPTALFLDKKLLHPGTLLTGGEALISTASGEPSFSLDISQEQAQAIPSDARITIPYNEASWEAIITSSGFKQDETSGTNIYSLTLAAPDGGTVCGTQCSLLPATENLFVPANIEIVPAVSGPTVPITALTSHPDGHVTVTLVEGSGTRDQEVTVKASIDGKAVVDGLSEGQVVRVYASSGRVSTSPGSSSSDANPSPDPAGTPDPGESSVEDSSPSDDGNGQ